VGGAVEVTVCLHAVPDHLDAAVLAGWREGVDCALEAVEGARSLAGHAYLKSLSYSFPQTSHWAMFVFSFLPKQDNPYF